MIQQAHLILGPQRHGLRIFAGPLTLLEIAGIIGCAEIIGHGRVNASALCEIVKLGRRSGLGGEGALVADVWI